MITAYHINIEGENKIVKSILYVFKIVKMRNV